MRLVWDENAWADYLWWQTQDRKTLERINLLIRDILRNGNEGIGKPGRCDTTSPATGCGGSPKSTDSSTS